jgi:hypothetical protein
LNENGALPERRVACARAGSNARTRRWHATYVDQKDSVDQKNPATALRAGSRSGAQALAPLLATTGDDRSAGTCPHPSPKTMILLAATIVGLKCPLHDVLPFGDSEFFVGWPQAGRLGTRRLNSLAQVYFNGQDK